MLANLPELCSSCDIESVLFLTVTVVWLLRERCPGKLGWGCQVLSEACSPVHPALRAVSAWPWRKAVSGL